MTGAEAAILIATLVNAFPSARFTEENATVYERGIADLGPQEAQAAIGELIHSSARLPSIAEIRVEVMRRRRERAVREQNAETASRLRLGSGSDGQRIGPPASAWASTLTRMLEDSARYRRMTEARCKALGKPVPPDPGAPFLEIAQAGARGEDVGARVQREVIGAQEQEELERRFP
jgi:hypothetical protein